MASHHSHLFHVYAALQLLPDLVAEIVLCVKETNQRTHTIAYDILVALGERMFNTEGMSSCGYCPPLHTS